MKELKYVKTNKNEFIFFSPKIEHVTFEFLGIKSAGFCSFKHDNQLVECYGKSLSLGIKSEEQIDSIAATAQVYGTMKLI